MLNSPRIWMDREIEAFGRSLPEGSLVLDAGAGKQAYRSKFAHCRYEAADFEKVDKPYAKSTYVCDLKAIPVEDGRFDAILFTQVMEHLPDPQAAAREFHRVLRPGGRILYTGPFWYEEHEQPYDFYRYTQYGVRQVFSQAGLEVTELRWMDGYLASVAHQLKRMRSSLPLNPLAYGGTVRGPLVYPFFMALKILAPLLAPLAAWADSGRRHTASGFPMNYLAVVRKPA